MEVEQQSFISEDQKAVIFTVFMTMLALLLLGIGIWAVVMNFDGDPQILYLGIFSSVIGVLILVPLLIMDWNPWVVFIMIIPLVGALVGFAVSQGPFLQFFVGFPMLRALGKLDTVDDLPRWTWVLFPLFPAVFILGTYFSDRDLPQWAIVIGIAMLFYGLLGILGLANLIHKIRSRS